jgi:hypothetical protein
MPPSEDNGAPVNVAVELARLQGSVSTMLTEHARRIGELEARSRSAGGRVAQLAAVVVSVAGFLFVILDRVQWEG